MKEILDQLRAHLVDLRGVRLRNRPAVVVFDEALGFPPKDRDPLVGVHDVRAPVGPTGPEGWEAARKAHESAKEGNAHREEYLHALRTISEQLKVPTSLPQAASTREALREVVDWLVVREYW